MFPKNREIIQQLLGEILGCSAEGHVSHILSNRLSSRPMGWSVKGCNNISKLITYHYNGGGIAELLERKRYRVLNYNIISFKEAKEECIKNTKQEIKISKPIINIYFFAILTHNNLTLSTCGFFIDKNMDFLYNIIK